MFSPSRLSSYAYAKCLRCGETYYNDHFICKFIAERVSEIILKIDQYLNIGHVPSPPLFHSLSYHTLAFIHLLSFP